MDKDKERQEISIIGRLFSMEALLIVMGLFSLISGITTGETIQMFWGGIIIGGSILLYFIRKKDWKRHWEEQEQLREMHFQIKERERKEKEDAGKR